MYYTMGGLTLFIGLTVLLSALHATPTELAARLAELTRLPENDARFNEISNVPDELPFHHKYDDILDKMSTYYSADMTTETMHHTTLQSAAIQAAQYEEEFENAEDGVLRAMVTTMFGFMGGLMRRMFN